MSDHTHTVAEQADDAYEALRAINHRIIGVGDTPLSPPEVRRLLAALSSVSQAMAENTHNLVGHLAAANQAELYVWDSAASVETHMSIALAHLAGVRQQIDLVTRTLTGAAAALDPIGVKETL